MNGEIKSLAQQLGEKLKSKHLQLATAESCTGGGVSYAITAIAGSSEWFDRGFVTYSNEAKQELLNVPSDVLKKYSAVSEETVIAMAKGALKNSRADIAIAITGIAGPAGGSVEKPVGTVWIAWADSRACKARCFQFEGDRAAVREQTISEALRLAVLF